MASFLAKKWAPWQPILVSDSFSFFSVCWREILSQGADFTMKDFSAFIDTRRCENWIHKIISWKYLSEDLLCQFFSEHKCNSFLVSSMNSLQGVLKVSSCSSIWLNLYRGRWQVRICSWQKYYTERNKPDTDIWFESTIVWFPFNL